MAGDAASQTLQQGWLCFDLPSTARSALWLDAAGNLRYSRLDDAPGTERWDLDVLDPDTPTPTTAVRDVGPWPQPAGGDRLAFVRRDALTAAGSLWFAEPGREPVRLTSRERDVTSFAVDVAAQLAWFATQDGGLWQVPLAGATTPTAVAAGSAQTVWAVTADHSVLVRGRGQKAMETQRIAKPGAAAVRFADDADLVRVSGADVLLQDLAGGLWRVPAAGGPVVAVAGALPGDRLLRGSGDVWAIRRVAEVETLLAFDGKQLAPVVGLGPASWGSAARVPGGIVAALLRHDTDLRSHTDESDVCLIALAVKPLAVPTRSAPRRFEAAIDRLRAVLAAEGVAVKSLAFTRSEPGDGATPGPRLQVTAQGSPPQPTVLPGDPTAAVMDESDEPAALLKWLQHLHGRVTTAAGDPYLALRIDWSDGGQVALADWSAPQVRFLHRILLGDRVMTARDDFTLEWEGSVIAERRGDGLHATCSGQVKNTGGHALDLQVLCLAVEASCTTQMAPATALPSLAPGGTATWTVTWAAVSEHATFRQQFMSAGARLPAFDVLAARDLADWATTTARIVKVSGFRHHPAILRQNCDPLDPGLNHDLAHFDVPQGFAALDARARQKLAKLLWTEVIRHVARLHESRPPMLQLTDPEGHRWIVAQGTLEAVPSK